MEEFIVLRPDHKDLLLNFENNKMGESPTLEEQMKTWDAPWRAESLDHYLPLGWSFAVSNGESLQGYLLAQPLLFFRGLTQTLWVEWMSSNDKGSSQKLVEVIYRWARDKHFQMIVMEDKSNFSIDFLEAPFSATKQEGLVLLKTSKIK